jgi:hypothetical protein
MNQFEAAQKGDLQRLRVALTADNVNDVSRDGWTALHWACYYGQLDCIKYCIEMGANVDARTVYGSTSLHIASSDGSVNVATVLLDAGAMVDARNNFGSTPLYCDLQSLFPNHVAVAQLLVDRGAKVSNVILDKFVQAIPDWITAFIESRSNCRIVAIAIIGIHKYHRTTVTCNNDINVLRLIAKHIWSMRMDDVWSRSP